MASSMSSRVVALYFLTKRLSARKKPSKITIVFMGQIPSLGQLSQQLAYPARNMALDLVQQDALDRKVPQLSTGFADQHLRRHAGVHHQDQRIGQASRQSAVARGHQRRQIKNEQLLGAGQAREKLAFREQVD